MYLREYVSICTYYTFLEYVFFKIYYYLKRFEVLFIHPLFYSDEKLNNLFSSMSFLRHKSEKVFKCNNMASYVCGCVRTYVPIRFRQIEIRQNKSIQRRFTNFEYMYVHRYKCMWLFHLYVRT